MTGLVCFLVARPALAAGPYAPTTGIGIKQFSPDSLLRNYSVYATDSIYLPNQSGTANGGFFGSGGGILLGANLKMRSPVFTAVRNFDLGEGAGVVAGTVSVKGNFSVGTNVTFDSMVQVTGTLLSSGNDIRFNQDVWAKTIDAANNQRIDFYDDVHVADTFRTPSNNTRFYGTKNLWMMRANGTVIGSSNPAPTITYNAIYSPLLAAPLVRSQSQLPGYTISGYSRPTSVQDVNVDDVGGHTHSAVLQGTATGASIQKVFDCQGVLGTEFCSGDTLKPGYYGTLNLAGNGARLLLGEGVYAFDNININAGGSLVAAQPNGGRTFVYSKGNIQAVGSNTVIAPVGALNATGYGAGPGLFLGGSMMLVGGADIKIPSDLTVWATISAPYGDVHMSNQVKLFGQVFAKRIIGDNNIDFGQGAYIPFDPEKPTINISISPSGTKVPEADMVYYATIRLSNKNAYAVSFKYSTIVSPTGAPAGTAVAGTNFVSRADSVVVIKAGDTVALIPFTIKWDHVVMGDLTFYLNFTEPAGGNFGVGAGAYGDTAHVAAQITIIDRDHPPALRVTDFSAAEGDSGTTDFRFNVVFVDSATGSAYSGTVARDIQFYWKTSPLSASAGAGDYNGVTMGTVSGLIPRGQNSTTLVVKVIGDRRYEPTENFKVLLDTASLLGKIAMGPGAQNRLEAVGTIINDDSMPQVRMDNVAFPEGTSGRISQRIVTYLFDPKTNRALDSASSSQYPTKYSWSTADGTAGNSLTGTVKDTDYVAVGSTVRTIAAGKWTDTIFVSTVGDVKFEPDENFKINLVGLDSATKGTYAGTVTILNDDNQPIVELVGGSVTEGDRGARNVANFTVRLRSQGTGDLLVPGNAPTTNLIFDWSTFDSTAVGLAAGSSDSDFQAILSRRDTIYAGSVSKTLSVTIIGDNRLEANEAFSVRLSNLVNAAPPERNTTYAAMTILNDDAQPRVRVTADSIVKEGNVGDRRPSTFTVQLLDGNGVALPAADAPQLPVTFTWKTGDSTAKTSGVAISDTDFVQVSSDTVTMPIGAVKTVLTVRVKGDVYAEDSLEYFKVALTPVQNLSATGSALGAVGTIRDDDQPPVLTLTGVRQTEGNSGVTAFVVAATLNEISAKSVYFNWSTIDGSATIGDADYQVVTNRRDSIPSGRLTPLLPLSVYVNGDTRLEPDETFSVKLSNLVAATFAKNGTIDRDTVLGVILNDDAKPFLYVKPAVSINERTPAATPDTLRFPVTFLDSTGNVVTAALGVNVSYTWSTLDSAGDYGARSTDNDFVAQSSVTRTIFAGRPLLDTIKVAVTPDAKLEYDESFRVVVLSATNADTTSAAYNSASKGMPTAKGTILNDDAKPTIRAVDDSVKEPALSTDPDSLLNFVVTMTAPAGIPVTVKYQTEAISASPDAAATGDYRDTTGTITFAPGETSKTVSVKVHGDNVYEGSVPETVRFKLLPGNGNATIARDTAIGYIKDNDLAPILHVDYDTVAEGATANFTISLVDPAGNPAMSSLPVTFDWSTANITASAGNDYVAQPATSLTISPMTNSKQVQVATKSDNVANEGVETFRVLLSNISNATLRDSGMGFILDATAKPQVTINDTVVSEADGNAIFTIRLDRPSAIDLNFTWSTADNADKVAKLRARYSGSDSNYLAKTNVTLVIPAFSLVGTANIQINDNNLDEPDTLFYWTKLRKTSVSDSAVVVKDSIGVGGILDDDAPPTISITDTTVTEPVNQSSISVKARFYIKLSAASAKDVSGTWTTVDGTATSVATSTATADFKAASGTFTIPAGRIADSVLIEVYGDTLDEVSEAFKIKLLTSSNAPIIATDSVGNGTILDEDPLPLIYVRDTALNEPKTGTITYKLFAYLNRRSSKTVTVNWATADAGGVGSATAGADYVAGFGTLTFLPGDTVKTMSVTLNSDATALETIKVDSVTYYELFKMNLTNLANVANGDTTAVDTIFDSDDRPFVSIDSVTITEKDSLVFFHVSMNQVAANAVNITYATSDVTARAGADYTAKSGTLTIGIGKLKDSIGVQFKDDLLHENTETFLLNLLVSAQAKFANKTGLGTILDNDLEPTLSIFDSSVQEPAAAGASGLMSFRLHLSAASGLPITLKWGTADSTAQTILTPFDYVDTGSTMTIRAGMATDTTVTVRILGDSLYEGAEKFKLLLSGLAGATFLGNDSLAIGTITDNDPLPKVYIDSQTVKESETAVFKVRMERESGLPMTLNWSVLAGTATKGLDYFDTTGTLTINAGDLTGFVGVRTLADNVSGEGIETFKLVLKNLVGGAVGADTGLGRILDTNSLPMLSIDSQLNIHEADTIRHFNVTLTGAPSAVPIHVVFATKEGTAAAGVRYADTSGVLTIPAGATSGKIGVHILNDKIREPDTEFFTLVLNSADSARIAQPIGLGSVIDDGDFPLVKVGNADTVAEATSSVFTFQVVGITKDTVRVWWHTIDGTAKAGLDYAADSGLVTFLPGRTQASVSISTLADNLWEPTEGFSLRIDRFTGASGLVSPLDSVAKGWIRDEGAVPAVRFLSPDTSVMEDASDSVPVRLALSRPASVDIKVVVPRQVGTAKYGSTVGSGVDYTVGGLPADTLVFKAGDSLASFKVHVVSDSLDEYDETATWSLVPIAPITLGGKYDYTLTILDDDSASKVRFVRDTQWTSESDSVRVSAKLSRVSAKDIEVWYRTRGTATPGIDDNRRPGAHEVFVFKAGTDTASVMLRTFDDNISEGREFAVFQLDSTKNVAIDSAHAIDSVYIFDNDPLPIVSFVQPDTTVPENVGVVTFGLRLSNPASYTILVNVKGLAASATLDSLRRGSDVLMDSSTTYQVVFAPGDTLGSFSVRILDDGRVESKESFFLRLISDDARPKDTAKVSIVDNDRYPDVLITKPLDSVHVSDPKQSIAWTIDGAPQVVTDTVLVSGWNLVTRNFTDTAGNYDADSVLVWGDFTPPAIQVFKITGPNTHNPTKDTTWWGDKARTRFGQDTIWYWVRDSIQNADGKSWRVKVDTLWTKTDFSGDGLFPTQVKACDSVGNCSVDTGWIDLKQSKPVVEILTPPDGSQAVAGTIPVLHQVSDAGTTWTVSTTKTISKPGIDTILRCYEDDVGNRGCDSHKVVVEPVHVISATYLDLNGDGRIDAAVVNLDSRWSADSLPTFELLLNDSIRTGQKPNATSPFYAGPSRGTPMVVGKDTIWVAVGTYLRDSAGHVLKGADGFPLTNVLGDTAFGLDGKAKRDSSGRVLYKVPGNGKVDSTRLLVAIVPPFPFGMTGFDTLQGAKMVASWTTTDSTGKPTVTKYVDAFKIDEKVSPVVTKAEIHRVENYKDPDTLFVTGSEYLKLGTGGDLLQVGRCPTGMKSCDASDLVWVNVPDSMVTRGPDGRYWFLVYPDNLGIKPDYRVRFGSDVSDLKGNSVDTTNRHWSTVVTGAPRPDLVIMDAPSRIPSIPGSERDRTAPGGILIRTTKGVRTSTSKNLEWWEPGRGYISANDESVRSICPVEQYCNGPTVYVNRPARMIMYIYDNSGAFVTTRTIDISKDDLSKMEPDQLDRVSIELDWNHRNSQGKLVSTGIYVWRIVSYLQIDGRPLPAMTNQLFKVGVKIQPPGGMFY